MKVFRDRRVSVPSCLGITRCKEKGKVLYRLPLGYNNPDIQSASPCIGYLCDDNASQMYPNENYKLIFATEWERQFGDKPIPALKRIGMYAAVRVINQSTTVKSLLDGAFDEPTANSLVDFAMYSILFRTNVAEHFVANMEDYLLFSDTPFSDAYYSNLFKEGMPWEKITSFNIGWANWCKQSGVETVYLCIDGSNEDCDAKGVEFAEQGHNKSKKNKNIVSFTYAVTEQGMPVAYRVYRGGLVDAKAMKKLLHFFEDLGIRVKGVIIDRGYCLTNVFDFLRERKIQYVVMVKGKPEGFSGMYEEQEKNMKHNGDAFVLGTELYAVQRKVKLFKKSTYEDYLTIFFDHKNASGQESALMQKINKEAARIKKLLAKGKTVKIQNGLDSILYVEDEVQPDGSIKQKVCVNPIEYNAAIAEKGVYSILTSDALPAEEVDRLYNCRDASEKTYSILKTQLGYGTMRIHCTLGTQSKYFLGFICSIIRYFIEQKAIALGCSTNGMIDELKKIKIERLAKQYFYEDADKELPKKFFAKFGAPDNLMLEITKETNNRVLGVMPRPHPRKPGPKKGTHHVILDENGNVVKRKPGPKPGSKRAAINKDGTPRQKPGPKPGLKRGEFNADGSVRQKPGPKPGSQNKKKE